MRIPPSILAAFICCLVPLAATDSIPAPVNWNENPNCPRTRALNNIRQFRSEGYQVRDGYWTGVLTRGQPLVLDLHLFSGNNYWFSAASCDASTLLRISLFDSKGNPAGSEPVAEPGRATALISVARSGRYFLRLEMTEGDKAETSVVYSYK
mgnify:CR=1 FL=1|jgi:hypothetical protein